jgi:hypothetical protein
MTDAASQEERSLAIATAMESDDEILSYRDGFRNLLWFVRIESIVMLGMAGFLLWWISNVVPQDRYFAVGVAGNSTQMVGLREPNMNKQALLAWVSAAATQVMTFGFTDLEESFEKSMKNFSPAGWKSFQEALTRTALLKNVVAYQQLVTAIPISTPQIEAEGILEGEYRWVVSVTLAVTTRAGAKRNTNYQRVMMILVKMPTAQNPMGIGINTWVAQ